MDYAGDKALVPLVRYLNGWLKFPEIWKHNKLEVLDVVDDCFDP